MGLDGLFDILSQIFGNWRGPSYVFSNSRNGLKDALGLVAALIISRVNNLERYVPAEDNDGGTSAFIQATRLGTGKLEAFLLLIPPVITALILCVLLVIGLGNEVSAGKPYTKSLRELIRLGGLLMLDGRLFGDSPLLEEKGRGKLLGVTAEVEVT